MEEISWSASGAALNDTLVFRPVYTSKEPGKSFFGFNWRQSFHEHLLITDHRPLITFFPKIKMGD